MITAELIENLVLNENAYFYKKTRPELLSKSFIESVFRDASFDKLGRYLLNEVKCIHHLENKEVEYSICVFKYKKKPTFILEEVSEWDELKLAYIVIVDFGNYIAISKRNISGIKELDKKIVPIDYKTISSLFINNETTFEKLSMNNMNISDNVIRQKSIEAVDLKENISTFGLQSYILSNLRINNDDNKMSLSLNSSRINKFGKKSNLEFFIFWADTIIDKVVNFVDSENFLSSFATPLNFEKESQSLKPIAILLLLTRIYAEYEANRIESIKLIRDDDQERDINLISVLNKFARLMEVKEFVSEKGNSYYKVLTPVVDDLSISVNSKSITINSQKLKKIIMKFSDETEISIIDYFNRHSCFIINFDRVELVYSHRKLFKDSKLLGNTEAFLSVFKTYNQLEYVTSEKGEVEQKSIKFSDESVFGFVENNFIEDSQFFLCDDLGKEWADHIGLYEDSISFFHSKYKDSRLSASDFQDIVGQAQKNLGNLSPSDNQWQMKIDFWGNNYIANNTMTQIQRVRKGDSAEAAIEYFKKLKSYPNLKKKVFLVINFISKAELTDKLEKLKRNESFRERNEVIQILWFVSSLISSCNEVSAETYIICKP